MVFGKSLAYLMLEKYSLKYLRQYLTDEDFEQGIKHQMYITLHILGKELPEFRQILDIDQNNERACEKLGFIVSWIVTWFCYRMKNLEKIFSNFDFLMCTPKHMISIMTSLVIRQIVTKYRLKPGSDDEDVFTAFYSCSLDEIDWVTVRRQAIILEELEDYGKLDYKVDSGGIGKFLSSLKIKFSGSGDKIVVKSKSTNRVQSN